MRARFLIAASPSTAPSGAAPASPSPSANMAAEDFVPTKATLSIDGTVIPLPAKGFFSLRETQRSGVTFGVFKGEKATPANPAIPTMTIASCTKAISAADFTQADASTLTVLRRSASAPEAAARGTSYSGRSVV